MHHCPERLLRVSLADSSAILPQPSSFVNTFFKLFLLFYSTFSSLPCVSTLPLHNTLPIYCIFFSGTIPHLCFAHAFYTFLTLFLTLSLLWFFVVICLYFLLFLYCFFHYFFSFLFDLESFISICFSSVYPFSYLYYYVLDCISGDS